MSCFIITRCRINKRKAEMNMFDSQSFDLNAFELSAEDLGDFAKLEVVTLGDAMAMPETGASSGISSCNSCSCCASTSCCSIIKVELSAVE
jgi:Thiopeptide-type bacteriocin precursor